MRWKSYQVMNTLEETIERLAERPGRARLVAGGTDLIAEMEEKVAEKEPLTLLDISRIEEIRGIKESGPFLVIGSATTISELAASSLIQVKARALARGAGWLGSPQIRNVATIGGNVVNGRPAGDTTLPLIALEAEARILSQEGERYEPVESLFMGVGKTAIDPFREILTHFRVPPCERPRRASAMERLAKRRVFTLPTLSVSVCLELNEREDCFQSVRIVAAPVGPVPWRARKAEASLTGANLSTESIHRAAALAREEANPRSSLRGGSAYRKDMVEVLTKRALIDALSQLNKVLYG